MTTTETFRFELGCTIDYWLGGATALVFGIEPAQFARQVVLGETLVFSQDCAIERYSEPSGDRHFRIHGHRGPLRIEYAATVELSPQLTDPALVHEVEPERLPLDVLAHLYPSRYCQSDRLELFAQRIFGHVAPGHGRITALCNWVCHNIEYAAGSSTLDTSATDTLLERHGVCRDFAHLGIALCRALGVPARYVSAYAWRLHPPDFHAVFEAWLHGPDGGAWYLFDPTRRAAPQGLIRIGTGQDAGETPYATLFGVADSDPPAVWINGPDIEGAATVLAVSMGV